VDFDRARQGLTEMTAFIRSFQRGEAARPVGALAGFLRILMQYPEIPAWEQMRYPMRLPLVLSSRKRARRRTINQNVFPLFHEQVS
jgi:hypothetical protein